MVIVNDSDFLVKYHLTISNISEFVHLSFHLHPSLLPFLTWVFFQVSQTLYMSMRLLDLSFVHAMFFLFHHDMFFLLMNALLFGAVSFFYTMPF